VRIDELKFKYPILESAIEIIKKEDKIDELFEMQKEAIEKGVLEDGNFLICTATGSGKTLIAELASIKTILEKKGKVLYLAPLRALVSEKFEDFQNKYSKLGIKFALSIGDYDKDDPHLKFFDMIFTTYEKADSLLRHKSEFFDFVKLVIVDEIHEIRSERGATLEVLICLLKEIFNPRFIFLSATIGNPKELADWLNSKLILSNFRPVELREGVYFNGKLFFEDEEKEIDDLIKEFLKDNGQILIFANSRKEAENKAKELSSKLKFFDSNLDKISKQILETLESPTKLCKELAFCVKNGVAFHHAGLIYNQRRIIEENFRKGLIKIVVATPTLIAGVNLPARTVIISSIKRFVGGSWERWPVSLYKQAVGRAGRIKYDKIGYAITIAKNKQDVKKIFENYINGFPEDVYSNLSYLPALRSQILSLIANEFCNDFPSLLNFFEKTFFYYSTQDKEMVERIIKEVVKNLENWGFVENFKATKVGKRVSELYLDPLTAFIFIKNIEKIKEKLSEISFFQLLACSTESKGIIYLKEKEYDEIFKYQDYIVEETELFEEDLKTLKIALILNDWINEVKEDDICEKYEIYAGDLFVLIEIFKWLSYSFSEICKLLNEKFLANFSKKIEIRIEKGVKEELLELVSIEGIGRIRARNLYNAGFKSLDSLRKASLEDLIKVKGIGIEIAKKIKERVS